MAPAQGVELCAVGLMVKRRAGVAVRAHCSQYPFRACQGGVQIPAIARLLEEASQEEGNAGSSMAEVGGTILASWLLPSLSQGPAKSPAGGVSACCINQSPACMASSMLRSPA